MIDKEKGIFDFKFLLLVLGFILLLFGSTILFTRPALWNLFNFSETGQIGDTIGGITAPVINLIGAILIYISFKAQINANRIQYKLLHQQSINQILDNNFHVSLELFKEIKEDYRNLSYKDASNQGALNLFGNEINKAMDEKTFKRFILKPIFFDWKFILCQYDLILNHINTAKFREDEKTKVRILIANFYSFQIDYTTEIIKNKFQEYDLESDTLVLINIINSSPNFITQTEQNKDI